MNSVLVSLVVPGDDALLCALRANGGMCGQFGDFLVGETDSAIAVCESHLARAVYDGVGTDPPHHLDLVPETPTVFAGHTYTARRNEDPEPDGTWRWQIFRDDLTPPVGYLQSHFCPLLNGEPRIRVFGPDNVEIGQPKVDKDDGCLGHYGNALAWLRMEDLRNR
jgi:hypothetical protein